MKKFGILILSLILIQPSLAQNLTLSKRDKEAARQHYQQQRLYLTSDNINGYLDLGKFCQDNGLFPEALQLYKKVMALPNITLDSRQNVARLIQVTEENGAITLYNKAVVAWQQDHNFLVAQGYLELLGVRYPTTDMAPKAIEFLQTLKEEEITQKELRDFEARLKRVETDNFVVYSPDEEMSKRVGQLLEAKRIETIERFGFLIFPSWGRAKAKVTLFPTREAFLKYAYSQDWSGAWTWQVLQEGEDGQKRVSERAIYTYAEIPNLETSVLPHEVTHLVFREFFGFSQNIPKWLDEGVALWTEDVTPVEMEEIVYKSALTGELIPLELYFYIQEYPKNPALFYAQAYSLVQFLIKQYGIGQFIQFIKSLSLNNPLEASLLDVYSNEFLDLLDLEVIWKAYLMVPSS